MNAGDRVRWTSNDILTHLNGTEGVVVSLGQKTAFVRFDWQILKPFHCSQERIWLSNGYR